MLDSAVDAGTTDFAIAVDRKSTPGTAAWIRAHLRRRRGLLASLLRPARVVEFTWQDDFAHARNVALDLVPRECDWWYAIDADDRLECVEGTSLPKYLGGVPQETRSVCIRYVYPHEVQIYETFFRGPAAYRWVRAWGEQVEPLDRTCILQSGAFRRVHDQDRSIPRRRNRNLRVMLKAAAERPEDPVCWAFLGHEHADRWEFEEAADCLRRAIDFATHPRRKYGYNLVAAHSLLKSGWTDEVLRFALAARAQQPQFPESYIYEGLARLDRGEFTEAIVAVEAGLARMPTVADIWERQHAEVVGDLLYLYEVAPFDVLASAYGHLGRINEALASVDRALATQLSPSAERFFFVLKQLLLRGRVPRIHVGRDLTDLAFATTALISRIRGYETLADLRHDLDDKESELARQVMAGDVLVANVASFVQDYFGETVAGAA